MQLYATCVTQTRCARISVCFLFVAQANHLSKVPNTQNIRRPEAAYRYRTPCTQDRQHTEADATVSSSQVNRFCIYNIDWPLQKAVLCHGHTIFHIDMKVSCINPYVLFVCVCVFALQCLLMLHDRRQLSSFVQFGINTELHVAAVERRRSATLQ